MPAPLPTTRVSASSNNLDSQRPTGGGRSLEELDRLIAIAPSAEEYERLVAERRRTLVPAPTQAEGLAEAIRQVRSGADFSAVVVGLAPLILSGSLAESIARSTLCAAYAQPDGDDLFTAAMMEAAATPTEIPVLCHKDPLKSADAFLSIVHSENGRRLLHRHRDDFYRWVGTHYAVLDAPLVRGQVWRFLPKGRLKPNSARVSNVVDALQTQSHLPDSMETPFWIGHTDPDYPPIHNLVPLRSGLLDPISGVLYPPTPNLFYRFCLPFDYSPDDDAPPREWLNFLNSVWPDDPQSIDTLQEMFGYFLTPDLSMEKMFLIVGPMRSGKGTIIRVLTGLLGLENVAAGSLDILSGEHGLQSLLGKSMFVDPDCMVKGGPDLIRAVAEIKKISGQDPVIVNPKNRPPYTVLLRLKILLCANELPRFADSSNALSSRFVIIKQKNSFLGNEDQTLKDRLLPELPRILHWALAGRRRLYARGYFDIPESAKDLMEELQESSSPIKAFLNEKCDIGPTKSVSVSRLWGLWKEWCDGQGRKDPGTQAWFGRDLRSAIPGLDKVKSRVGEVRTQIYKGLEERVEIP